MLQGDKKSQEGGCYADFFDLFSVGIREVPERVVQKIKADLKMSLSKQMDQTSYLKTANGF